MFLDRGVKNRSNMMFYLLEGNIKDKLKTKTDLDN